MADLTKPILSYVTTVSDKVKDLVIKEGQLIFVYDEGRLALDYKGKRTFYNQIIELETDQERTELSTPINGKYYFVIETAIFWRYFNGWKQLTSSPDGKNIFIGTQIPEVGESDKLYVDKDRQEISVWDDEQDEYLKISNFTKSISADEISALF